MNVSRQIGWSQESNLLYQILKQLNKLTSIMFGLKPKYKVYTALLTQSGGDNAVGLNSGSLIIGVTYFINDIQVGMDFTNVGAPNNNVGTYFVATGTTPNSWGIDIGAGVLIYNEGAPVVTVLENTIGNIWFTYDSTGLYYVNSSGLFNNVFVPFPMGSCNSIDGSVVFQIDNFTNNSIRILTLQDLTFTNTDDALLNTPIEIRVYN